MEKCRQLREELLNIGHKGELSYWTEYIELERLNFMILQGEIYSLNGFIILTSVILIERTAIFQTVENCFHALFEQYMAILKEFVKLGLTLKERKVT